MSMILWNQRNYTPYTDRHSDPWMSPIICLTRIAMRMFLEMLKTEKENILGHLKSRKNITAHQRYGEWFVPWLEASKLDLPSVKSCMSAELCTCWKVKTLSSWWVFVSKRKQYERCKKTTLLHFQVAPFCHNMERCWGKY